jgi:hypothetical protein
MRVRVIAPVAFNGTHRVFEGEEYDVPDDMPLGSAYERISDAPAPEVPRPPKGKRSASPRVSDVPIG